MIYFNIILFLSLGCFHLAVSENQSFIPHCYRTNDHSLQATCSRCKTGFLLNHLSTVCQPINSIQANCLQKSILEECMRCDCGYVLSEESGLCIPTPSLIIGCEVFNGDYSCIRPKKDFSMFMESSRIVSLQFARGTNCEIRDYHNGRCEQCHSGYQLDSALNCLKSENTIVNEFFSYFSKSGELRSRNIQFVPDIFGVFPKIPFCDIQINYNRTNIDGEYISSTCQKCIVGKVPNASRTKCLKSPFEQCGLVSDSDPNICIQCENNEDFYLSQDNHLQQLSCLPRKSIDPTDNCLISSGNLPYCLKCANGLVPTFSGCAFKGWSRNIVKDNAYNPKIQDALLLQQFQLISSICLFWSEDNHCKLCQPGWNVDDHGQCQLQTIKNCVISSENGSCHKCESLFYLSETNESCISLTNIFNCQESSGMIDRCDTCSSLTFESHDGSCQPIYQFSCIFSLGKNNECQRCFSLYYLETPTQCSKITSYNSCLFSDGLANACLICSKNYFLDQTNSVCILQMEIIHGKCASPIFYLNQLTNECIQYSFENYEFCAEYHPTSNGCVQCYEKYFLTSSKYCKKILFCEVSDGLTDWCFCSSQHDAFINEIGQVQNVQIPCRTNLFENICGDCQLPNGQLGIPLDEDSCVSKEKLDSDFQFLCFHLKSILSQEDTGQYTKRYYCDVCLIMFYPDSKGSCVPLFQADKNCQANNGRSKDCLLCARNHSLNHSSGLCELNDNQTTTGILFCEIMQDNSCIKCQNLFYIKELRCFPIVDPECLVSDGISNICRICKLGYILDAKKTTTNLCVPEFCEDIQLENLGNCLKCLDGFVFKDQKINIIGEEVQTKLGDNSESSEQGEIENGPVRFYVKPYCDIINDPHCLVESYYNGCLKCEQGYQMIRHSYPKAFISTCLKMRINNCLKATRNGMKCVICEVGYILLENGQCFILKGCIEYLSARCTQCEDNYYLKAGNCWRIPHCREQRFNKCVECESGYSIKKDQVDLENLVKENEEECYGSYVFNFSISLYQLRQRDSDECMLIPHCKTSDGQSYQCYECEKGYFLQNQICIREEQTDQNCLIYGITASDCIQCESLYFPLNNQSCVEISGFMNCWQSNGIDNQCEFCQQFESGYLINSQGFCDPIPNCLISNGIDSCLLCDSGYLIDFKEGKCIEQVESIEFCVEYSLDNQSKLKCSRCQNLHYPFEGHCTQLDEIDIHKCLASDGIHNECQLCEQGFFLRYDLVLPKFICSKSKKFIIQDNLGCQQFYHNARCAKCFSKFYFDQFGVCRKRNLMSKCLEYHPSKDACLVCSSGYLPKRIEQKKRNDERDGNSSELYEIICLKMNEKQRVNNCKEYLPNTSNCVKCNEKLTNLGVIQFFLNKTANMCEGVLHLMCQTIDPNTKKCLKRYIPNCELYAEQLEFQDQSQCLKCRNGYFLQENKLICVQHRYIDNCREYSQSKQDSCEICEELFFVDEDYRCSPRNPENILNCRVHSIYSDSCLLCFDKFAADSNTRSCTPTEIPNCAKIAIVGRVQESPGQNHPVQNNLNIQVCLACYANFILAENNQNCILKILDKHNCLQLNAENHDCQECKAGFLLTNMGDCIEIDSLCLIENCLKLSKNSTADDFVCEECAKNNEKDVNSKCSLIDPDSNIHQEEIDTRNNTNSMGNQQPKDMIYNCLKYFLGVSCIVLGLLGVVILWKRHFSQSIEKKSVRKGSTTDFDVDELFKNSNNSSIQMSQILENTKDEEKIRQQQQEQIQKE